MDQFMRLLTLTLFIYFFQAVVINQIILRESLMELMIWLNGLKTTLHIMLLMSMEE